MTGYLTLPRVIDICYPVTPESWFGCHCQRCLCLNASGVASVEGGYWTSEPSPAPDTDTEAT